MTMPPVDRRGQHAFNDTSIIARIPRKVNRMTAAAGQSSGLVIDTNKSTKERTEVDT